MYIPMKQAQSLLPKVGDVLWEIPTIGKTSNGTENAIKEPQECIVVEVHPAQLWYRVRFTATGFHECYKVPKCVSARDERKNRMEACK